MLVGAGGLYERFFQIESIVHFEGVMVSDSAVDTALPHALAGLDILSHLLAYFDGLNCQLLDPIFKVVGVQQSFLVVVFK